MEKYCRTVQATDDNMAHVHCILNNQVYKQTLRISITYRFSTATMAARKCLNVTSSLHFLQTVDTNLSPFKDKAQTALFKDPVRTAL